MVFSIHWGPNLRARPSAEFRYAVDPHLRNDLSALFLLRVRPPVVEEIEVVPVRIAGSRVSLARGGERDWFLERFGARCAGGVVTLTVFSGTANPALAATIAGRLGITVGASEVRCFPDGELHVELRESVRGGDVYLVQPTAPPVERHLLELLLLADACRRAGAARVTAVLPYFGYARQDRRASGREAVGARVVADLFGTRGFARLVALDLHSAALEGFFASPLEHVSAVPVLGEALGAGGEGSSCGGVVVAPDAGAAKLAERYAAALRLPVAIVQKVRVSASEVAVRGVTGDVRDRAPVIVDDMISTGGTIVAATSALLAVGCAPDVTVVATHGLFVGPALGRLAALRPRRLLVTDSVEVPQAPTVPLQIVGVGPLLADVIARLHEDRSLGELLVHG